MKKWNLLAMVLVLSALFCLADSGAAYSGGKMKDLGTLRGERGSTAMPLVSMTVVKSLDIQHQASGNNACLFILRGQDDGPGHPAGGASSAAYGINDSGQIVGWSEKYGALGRIMPFYTPGAR